MNDRDNTEYLMITVLMMMVIAIIITVLVAEIIVVDSVDLNNNDDEMHFSRSIKIIKYQIKESSAAVNA